MTSNRLLRFLPLLTVFILICLSKALFFNGLYGQDGHEYLRLSQVYYNLLRGLEYAAALPGDVEFAVGYPLSGASLQYLGLDALLALRTVSWVSAGLALWLFDQCLRLLTPGAQAESRWVFIGVSLALAPYFVRAGLTVMSDMLGLALLLAALANSLRVLETGQARMAIWAMLFAGLAVATRFALAAMLVPMSAMLCIYLLEHKKWRFAVLAIGAGALGFLPHFWLKTGPAQNVFGHSLAQDWSLFNLFRSHFSNVNGTVDYRLPNVVYLFFPLAHPGFCLLLPGLFALAKKTDLHLASKKALFVCLLTYLLFLGGVSHQNMRFLLPAYAILLLLFFPAWDRMFAYGFYFFKRLTFAIIALVLAVQVLFAVWIIAPVISRNRLETAVAAELRRSMPPGATLFAFDLDIALRTYLPDFQIQSLWGHRYEDFPPGSFILFNEPALRTQWQGQNPMLNWEFAKTNFKLREVRALPRGWTLYKVEAKSKVIEGH